MCETLRRRSPVLLARTHLSVSPSLCFERDQVRAFYPESGELKFVIPSAHHESVTALAICHDDETRPPWRLVTGGQDGRVRVWNVTSSHQVGTVKHQEAGVGRGSSGILKTPCVLCV